MRKSQIPSADDAALIPKQQIPQDYAGYTTIPLPEDPYISNQPDSDVEAPSCSCLTWFIDKFCTYSNFRM